MRGIIMYFVGTPEWEDHFEGLGYMKVYFKNFSLRNNMGIWNDRGYTWPHEKLAYYQR
jgi:hypothetical protein